MMKKLKHKLSRKKQDEAPPSRITNETVAEHRERILAGGRKFKYPVQYARHRLIINTVVITLVVLILGVLIGWWQLYKAQSSNEFFFRVTQLAPLPVAAVDGYPVRYSNYLMKYRSSIHYLEQQRSINPESSEGQRQKAFYKRQALNEAVADAYGLKLAGDRDVTVTGKEVEEYITQHRESQRPVLSEQAYEQVVLQDFFGWSLSEYREDLRNALIRQKVSFEIDDKAKERIAVVENRLKQRGASFAKVAQDLSEDEATKARGGDIGFVPKNNQDQNRLTAAALKLEPGQVSDVVKGSDGYYIIRLIEETDNRIRYARIKVALTAFNDGLAALKEQNKVTEYIEVSESDIEPVVR